MAEGFGCYVTRQTALDGSSGESAVQRALLYYVHNLFVPEAKIILQICVHRFKKKQNTIIDDRKMDFPETDTLGD